MAINNATNVAAMLARRKQVATSQEARNAECGMGNGEAERDKVDVVDKVDKVDSGKGEAEMDWAGYESLHVSARVDCILGGALMQVTVMGMSPEKVVAYLREKDPGVKFQDEFPKRGGFGGGGAKEIKTGVLNSITIKGGKYCGVEMVVLGDDGEPASVTVGKNKLESWPAEFVKMATEADMAKSAEYLGGKDGSYTRVASQLADGAAVTIKYSPYDGRNFFTSLEVVA